MIAAMKNWLIALLCVLTPLHAEKTDIHLWHAFDGYLEETFNKLVEDFNQNSSKAKIILTKKGNYRETFEAGIAGNPPHILQVYEVATETMSEKKGLFRRLSSLLPGLDPNSFIPPVRDFYTNKAGEMLSLPWNASTGVLFYNKNAFVRAGLDPESPPQTWDELAAMGEKLVEAGCMGYTTAWPAAYHVEHIAFLHHIPLFSGEGTLNFLQPGLIFHLQKVIEFASKGIFAYKGRFGEAETFFSEGKCGILMQGANRYTLIKENASFDLGVAPLPYWPSLIKKPENLNIGGSSFWIMEGFSRAEYEAVKEFFEHLIRVNIQVDWHKKTGFLPISRAAADSAKEQGFSPKNPAAGIAVESVTREETSRLPPLRVEGYEAIRNHLIDCLEEAFAGKLTAEQALQKATNYTH